MHQKKEKKGEELLDAKGMSMAMRFLKLAMSKISSIISAVIVNFAFWNQGESLCDKK